MVVQNPFVDKHFTIDDLTALENLVSDNEGVAFENFKKQLTHFKKSGKDYQKVASKTYSKIKNAEEDTKNLAKILFNQEKFIAQNIFNPNLPPLSKKSKKKEVSINQE